MESSAKKIPYIPSQEFRYELSLDEYSRKRFRVLMEIYKELQATIPEIPISFCMFGSLTKGKVLTSETAECADIDLDIKFDKKAWDEFPLKKHFELRTKFGVSSSNKIRFVQFDNFVRYFVLQRIQKVKNDLGFNETTGKTVEIFITPIDSESIQSEINNINYNKNQTNSDERLRLAVYFMLSIGNVVKKYRNKFLKELVEMKDRAEAIRIWNLIKECVEEVERQGQIPEKIIKQFPQTLEESLKFYEVDMK